MALVVGANQPQRIDLESAAGPLAAWLHLPLRTPAPVIVCCHGMLSSKDSPKFALIAEEFSRAGAAVLRFDFSGCGESRALLGEDLLSSRLRDLHAVLDYVQGQHWCNGSMGLFGSSLGGYLSLLALASGRWSLTAAVCWATPFDLGKIKQAMGDSAELKKFFPADFCLGSPRNLHNLAGVSGVMVVHGQQDEVVPWQDALSIHDRLSEPKRLLLVKQAEHRFLDPACRMLALKASLEWFKGLGLIPS